MRALALLACAGCSQILGIGAFQVGDANDLVKDAHVIGQGAKLVASNAEAGDQFGTAVAASADGNTIAVSAYLEDGAAIGIGGNEADNTKVDSGALYVFVRSGATWMEQAYIKASNTDAGDGFGRAVAISADGNTIVVSANLEDSAGATNGAQTNSVLATDEGAAYVFTRTGTTWTQSGYLKPSTVAATTQDFGFSVAISGDGTHIAVGTPFEDTGGANAGAVYTYSLGGAIWAFEAKLKASNAGAGDDFGYDVAYSTDGTTLVVGAPTEDSAATGVGGTQASEAALDAGAVYVFTRAAAVYTQQAYVKASNTDAGDQFGHGVGLSGDGNTLVVGAPREASANAMQTDNTSMQAGAAYLFTRAGATWSQQVYLKAQTVETGALFGYHAVVRQDGSAFAICAPLEDSNAVMDSGGVYLFTKAGVSWTETHLAAAMAGAGDRLEAIGMLGTTLVAGALFDDSTGTDAGATYVFE